MMEEYFKCNFFDSTYKEFLGCWSLSQKQLIPISTNGLKPETINYECEWIGTDDLSGKPVAIVPIRDNSELLEYTLNNFKQNGFFEYAHVIVVDDRSVENLRRICQKYEVNYLRVVNKIGFNFSMLNNIPAFIASNLGATQIVLWNSDLWIDKIESFDKLLKLHNEESSTISGSKLLYPFESLNSDDSINIKTHFPDKLDGSYKGTVQFGGSRWMRQAMKTSSGNVDMMLPYHFLRFAQPNAHRVNSNYATEFVTGALQLIDLRWFIDVGGLNPSLAKVFQDVDLCLRAVEEDKKVMYFGKDMQFFHDESYNHYSNRDEKKMDLQFSSDHGLFTKIWKDRIFKIFL
jgi:GT2 family glycosyltransferase